MASKDIRIIKTQRALALALLTLLEKQSFPKITVNDICQEALVSRSTFYVHFEDKYMLLRFCLQEMHARLQRQLSGEDAREPFRLVLEGIQSNARVLHNLLASDLNLELAQIIQSILLSQFTEALERHADAHGELVAPIPLMASFYAAGIAGMNIWWIRQNFSIPIEEMAEYQYQLLKGMLGHNPIPPPPSHG